MAAHKVSTSERNGGYMARCNDCDAITFGGFPTRAAAREAIATEHDTETKEAPESRCTATEGQHPETHSEGNEMTDTSLAPTTPTNNQLARALAVLNDVGELKFNAHADFGASCYVLEWTVAPGRWLSVDLIDATERSFEATASDYMTVFDLAIWSKGVNALADLAAALIYFPENAAAVEELRKHVPFEAAPFPDHGDSIYTVRCNLGVTREQVAKPTGYTVHALAAIETGDIPTDPHMIRTLMDAITAACDFAADAPVLRRPVDACAEPQHEGIGGGL